MERTEGEAGIFAGAQLCVMVDNYKPFGTSKQGLERLIHKHHGKCVQNPMDSTDYVIAASSKKLKVRVRSPACTRMPWSCPRSLLCTDTCAGGQLDPHERCGCGERVVGAGLHRSRCAEGLGAKIPHPHVSQDPVQVKEVV